MDRRSTLHRILLTPALLGIAIAIGLAPARSAAAPRGLCIVRLGDVPGLAAAELGPALQLERRKSGESLESRDVGTPSECPADAEVVLTLRPPATAVIGAGGTASPVAGRDGGLRLDLSDVDPLDRAAEVARIVASRLGPPSSMTTMVEAEVERLHRPSGTTGPGTHPRGYVRLGGFWAWESGPDVHAAGMDVEAGASMLDERLDVGVRAGWEPPRSIGTPAGLRRAQAVPVVAVLRGGLALGRVRLLAGLAGGIEWRNLEVRPATRFGRLSRNSVAGVLEGSIEAGVAVVGALRLSLAGVVRGYLGGPSFVVGGRTAFEAPAWAAGLAFRVGAVFPAPARTATTARQP